MDRPSHPLGCCGCCYEKDNRKLLLSNTTPTCNTLAVRRGIPATGAPLIFHRQHRHTRVINYLAPVWRCLPLSLASCRPQPCAVRPRAAIGFAPSGLVPRPCAVLRPCAVYPASCRGLAPSSGIVPSIRPRAAALCRPPALCRLSGLVPGATALCCPPALCRLCLASCRGLVLSSGLVPSTRPRAEALCRPPALCRLSGIASGPCAVLRPCSLNSAVCIWPRAVRPRAAALCRPPASRRARPRVPS